MLRLAAPPDRTVAEIAQGFARGRALHLLNFHSTPRERANEYRRQIAACAARYAPFARADLDAWLDGTYRSEKPPLIPILFEGFRDNYDVILPILEDYGFIAWFFVPSWFPNVPPEDQRTYAAAHRLHYPRDNYPGERIVMTWTEARDCRARGHVFACHSRNHTALNPDTPDAVLEDEIVTAKREMETGLNAPVDMFCWLHGAETGVNPRADSMLRGAGYRYLLSNFRLQRLQ